MTAKFPAILTRSLTALAFVALALGFPRLGLALDPPCVDPSDTPNCYATIQEAVTAASPGETINVAAGTYSETVTIDKPLTLNGAQAGVDARGRVASETVVSSTAAGGTIVIGPAAGTVTIDGFDLSGTPTAGAGVIYVSGLTSNVVVINNIVQPSTADGILLWNAAAGSVEHNWIKGAADAGISGGRDAALKSVLTILNNQVDDAVYGISGYLDASTISDNLITGTASGSAGIGGQFYNTSITGNLVSGYTAGAGLAFEDYLARGMDAIDVQDNSFTANSAGINVNYDITGLVVTVNHNSIAGNLTGGVVYGASGAGTLDAESNWWGDASGPGPVGPGTGDTVSANVDFLPWCGDAACSFLQPAYTLTYTAGANGSITGTSPQTVNHGSDGTEVTAVPDANYQFVSWSDGVLTASRTDLNVTGDITAQASFAINSYTLTYTAGANGSITGTSPQTVAHGSDGTEVTAVADANYHFVSWSDGVLTASRTETNVTANKSVTASFAIDTYTLTYTAGANGSITGTSPQTVNHGANGTLVTAVPDANYHFVSWSDGVLTASRTETNVTADKSVTASFAIDTYTLTYTAGANGSITGTSPQTVAHGADGTLVTAVPDANYHFVSWSDGVLTASRTETNVTANKSVTASFAIDTYTLTYTAGANGSITGTSPQTVNHGANGTLVTAVPDANYHFVSWSDGVLTASRTETNVTADKSVTASFAIDTYTLTYTAGANGAITGTTPQTVNHGASGTEVTAVPATGYHFVTWSDSVLTASRTDTNVTANKSVTASFAINTYTLTYTAGANGSITGTSPQTVNHGASGTAVSAVPATGYHFVNWSDLSTTNPRTDTNVLGNITVTANFAINTYTLTYTAGANGSITGTTPQTVNHGASGTEVTAVPATGYHFVTWSDSVLTASRTDTNVIANKSVTASFAINTYTLTYTAGANGSITGTTPQTVNHGASGSEVTAVPATGHHFVNWSDLSTANPRTDTNVLGNITVTANFAINTYTLTYTAGANGSITGTSPQTVNHGASGTAVTAVAATGYHFVNWSDLSTANPRTDTNVTANKSVTANFAINTYTLTYTAAANGSISGTTPQTVNHGASGTAVTAVPASGYHFVNWSDFSTANPRTDTNVTANKSVTAFFAIGIDIAYNGGFEEGDLVTPGAYPSGWVPNEWSSPLSTFTWDTSFRHSGDRSVKIQSTTANDARWIQTVSVQPNATYRLSGWIATDNVEHNLGEPNDIGANLSVLDGTVNYTIPLFGDNGWIPVSLEFNSGSRTSVIIAARLGMYSGTTVGVAWFDDIKLALLSSPTCYSLTTVASPVAGGSVNKLPIPNCGPGATYAHGTVVTLTAAPAAGYSFAGWTGSGCSGTGTCAVTMTVARSVTANFTVEAPPANAFFPGAGSTSCFRPQVGMQLILDPLMRTAAGAFDPATVTFKLDGTTVTHLARITQSTSSPASHATILYTPPSDLSAGPHTGTLIYPTPGGPVTYNWNFTAANIACPSSGALQAPLSNGQGPEDPPGPPARSALSAPAETGDDITAPVDAGESIRAPVEAGDDITAPVDAGESISAPPATVTAPVFPRPWRYMPYPGLYRLILGLTP